VPGESYLAVLDALYDARDSIRLVVARQDGGAAYMPRPGPRSPGAGDLLRDAGARRDQRFDRRAHRAAGLHSDDPFHCQVPGEFSDRESFQEMDYRHMFGPMSKWVAQIDRPNACTSM